MFMGKIVKKIYHIRKYENLDHEIQRRQQIENQSSVTKKDGYDIQNTSIDQSFDH